MLRRRSRPRMLGEESGFTLVELLMASAIGLVILGSATLITIGAGKHNNEVASRTDANQRGRLAMERIERLLRSEACVSGIVTPLTAATPTSVTIYSDIAGGSNPMKHTITFDATAKTITDTAAPASNLTATTTTTLATNVVSDTGKVFQYYAFPTTVPGSGIYTASQELVPPVGGLVDTDRARIARIDINFLTTGALRTTANIRAPMSDQVFLRTADPNRAAPAPACS